MLSQLQQSVNNIRAVFEDLWFLLYWYISNKGMRVPGATNHHLYSSQHSLPPHPTTKSIPHTAAAGSSENLSQTASLSGLRPTKSLPVPFQINHVQIIFCTVAMPGPLSTPWIPPPLPLILPASLLFLKYPSGLLPQDIFTCSFGYPNHIP